jgi:hypothetical protein
MAGRWTELWDEDRQKWVKVFIDLPKPLTKGSATTASSSTSVLYGPDRRPLPPRSKTIGFHKD